MFAATETLTINSVPYVLNRVNQDSYGSEYSYVGATDSVNMKIRHSTDSVDGDGITMLRHNVFVEHVVYPTATTEMEKYTYTCTIRVGKYNDPDEGTYLGQAVEAWLGTSTNLADIVAGIN